MSPNPVERNLAAVRQAAKRTPPKARNTRPPELYQIVIECRDEQEQRELFELLSEAGLKLRLLVL